MILETCFNSHLSADVSKLCTLLSASFPQIIKCAHTERFPSVSPQCHLDFVYLCVKWCILYGLLVGSLMKEVAFASCDGGTRDHDIFNLFPSWVSIAFDWGSVPPGDARTSLAVDQGVIWDETQVSCLGVPCCCAVPVNVDSAVSHMK